MYRGWREYLVSVADQGKKLLSLYALRQQGASGKWVLNRELGEPLEITIDKAGSGSIRACEVVVDERTGTRNLFLVLSQPQGSLVSASRQGTTVYRMLTYSPTRRKLLHYGEEVFPAISTEDSRGVSRLSILDGPIVVWTEGYQLQVMHPDSDHSHKILRQTYNLDNLVSAHFRLVKVVDLWPFPWTDETVNSFTIDCCSLFIVFLKLKVAAKATSSNDPSITEWVCLQVKLSRSLQGLAVKLLQESLLIPRDYGCISTCVALHRSYCAGLSSGDIGSKRQFLVGTEYRQVVLLHEGRPLQCVALKFLPCEINLLDNGTGQLSFGCRGTSGETSAFKIDEDGVQECGEWEGVRHLVVGDFARLGHEQLLLLFKDSELDFHVTDLAQFSTTVKEGVKEEEGPAGQQCAESLISVMNSLNLQRSNSEAYLTRIKTELQLKSELMRKSLSFMKSLEQKNAEEGEGRISSATSTFRSSDPSLVCIIPGEIDVPGSTAVTGVESGDQGACTSRPPPLKLVRLWQRLKSGKWVIGAVVQNQSSKVLKDVRFSIAPMRGQQACSLDCSSRVIWIEQSKPVSKLPKFSSRSTSSPPAKKRKIEQPSSHDLLQGLLDGDKEKQQGCDDMLILAPETRMCVVLSTSLPVMQSCGEQSVTIIATWMEHTAGETQSNSCRRKEEVAEVGAATLSYQLLCSGELNLNESCLCHWDGRTFLPQDVNLKEKVYQDLTCILGTSSFILIEARSHHTNLLSLPALLRSRLPLKSGAVITTGSPVKSASHDTAVRSDCGSCSLEALEGVAIHITPSASSARIAVLFRSMRHLSLLLASMRQCLPQDVRLQLIEDVGWIRSLRGCLTSILDEAKGECEGMKCRVREGGTDGGWSQNEAKKGLTELRNKTDWTISMANRK